MRSQSLSKRVSARSGFVVLLLGLLAVLPFQACGAFSVLDSTLTAESATVDSGSGTDSVQDGSDIVANTNFNYSLTLDLASGILSTLNEDLVIGASEGDGVRSVTLGGVAVFTLASDAYGYTLRSNWPDETYLELVLTGSLTQGYVTVFSNEKIKIVLREASIVSSNGPALNLQTTEKVFLVSEGTANTMTDATAYTARSLDTGSAMQMKGTVTSLGPIIMSGMTPLSVTGRSQHVVFSENYLRLMEGFLTVLSNVGDGFRAKNAFVMHAGNISVTAVSGAGKAVQVESASSAGYVVIGGGVLTVSTASQAIVAPSYVSVSGGRLAITASTAVEASGRLTISGGTLILNTTSDPFLAGNGVSVQGGSIFATLPNAVSVDSCLYSSSTQGLVLQSGLSSGLMVVTNTVGEVVLAMMVPASTTRALWTTSSVVSESEYQLSYGGSFESYAEEFQGFYYGALVYSGGTASRTFTPSSLMTVL